MNEAVLGGVIGVVLVGGTIGMMHLIAWIQAIREIRQNKWDYLVARVRHLEAICGMPSAAAVANQTYPEPSDEDEPERDPDLWRHWLANSGALLEQKAVVYEVAKALDLT